MKKIPLVKMQSRGVSRDIISAFELVMHLYLVIRSINQKNAKGVGSLE
jgi:hypothetical protein